MPRLNSILEWLKRNERRLSSIVFVFGFIGDLFTFAVLDLSLANLAFVAYLSLAAVATFLAHTISSRFDTRDALWRRVVSALAPLAAQYAIGSLLSGMLIFYTKSATLSVSWPFLILLAAIFLGNEVFRGYRAHLAFQTVLFFFTLYAYAIFALPLTLGHLGPTIFLESTGLAVAIFAAFLGLLAWAGWKRLKSTLWLILGGSAVVLVVLVGSYFTSLIPPIPLTMRDSGIYHDVQHVNGDYALTAETERPWWEFYQPVTIHHVAGTPLYAFSAVFAPGAFSASIIHEWDHYDTVQKKWVRESTIAFPLSGGRAGGYRGYSEITNATAGQWRVSIQTISGQTIGRINFTVVDTSLEPEVHTEVR
jgi:MFS family permease